MSSILKSSALIESIKLKGFIPESQETFTAEKFLEIATEKINIDLMSDLMDARGDYLVYFEDFPINETNSYPIPDRAHGNKLRDACIIDENSRVVRELTQISLEDLSDYRSDYSNFTSYDPFYIENDAIVLINTNTRPNQSIRMYFYMRPNKLVIENRAATVSQISIGFEVDTIAPKAGSITAIGLDGVITSANHGLKTGDYVIITGTDSTPSADGTKQITYVDLNSFTIGSTITTAGTVGSWALAAEVATISSVLLPKHFTPDIQFDVVQAKSPNKIKLYNLFANSINNTLKTLSFRTIDIKGKLIKGDYITKAEETIVPNIPTEYHPLLAQMVYVACMGSMADEQQKQSAMITLKEMEKKILKIVTNRVEGAPKKLKNRNSPLNSALRSRKIRRA